MTPDKRPYLAAAMWLQLREERLTSTTFNPYAPALRHIWTEVDQAQFDAAYREWLRAGRMA